MQEIKQEFSINPKRGICAIFAMYASDGLIPETTLLYLKELQKICANIILIGDNKIQKNQLAKIKSIVCYCEFSRHREYDFGSYKRGYIYAKQSRILSHTTNLIFCNDSCYAPVFSFEAMFETMEARGVDFWGITANMEAQYHLQSFFLVFSKKVFESKVFEDFISSITKEVSVDMVIRQYEIPLTMLLQHSGFSCDSYIPLDKSAKTYPYSLHLNPSFFPLWLLQKGCPLVKVKVFKKAFFSWEGKKKVLEHIKSHNKPLYNAIGLQSTRYTTTFSIIMILESSHTESSILDSINAIIYQTYQNFELIIINTTTDSTLESSIASLHKNIRFYYHPNTDSSSARNLALTLAHNEWIAYGDPSTIMARHFLEIFAVYINTLNYKTFYCKLKVRQTDKIICMGGGYIISMCLIALKSHYMALSIIKASHSLNPIPPQMALKIIA